MATHSSILAWRIPGTEEPGGLPSVGSHWSDLAAATAFRHTPYTFLIQSSLGGHLGCARSLHIINNATISVRVHVSFLIRLCLSFFLNTYPGVETWVRSLGREDALEEAMAAHSSILAWRTPWTEEPGGLESMGSQRVRHDWNDSVGTHVDTSSSWRPLHCLLCQHYWVLSSVDLQFQSIEASGLFFLEIEGHGL